MLTVLVFFDDRMSHQEKRDAMHNADGLPAFFMVFNPVLSGQAQRITEHPQGQCKRNAFLLKLIGKILVLIPCESGFRNYKKDVIQVGFQLTDLGLSEWTFTSNLHSGCHEV